MGKITDKIIYPFIAALLASVAFAIIGALINNDWKSFYDLTPNWILWSFFGLLLLWSIIILIKRRTQKLNDNLKSEVSPTVKQSNQIGNINGDNNTVTQIISSEGNDLSKNLEEFIKPLIESKQTTIDILKEGLDDKDEIILLNKENFDLKIQISDKQSELLAAEKRYANIFKEYNDKNLTSKNSLYSQAMNFMFDGNENKALEILSRKNIELSTEESDIIDSWFLRAELLKNKNNYGEELDECYEKIIELDSSFKNIFLTGKHFFEKMLFKKAENCFNTCLKLNKGPNEKVKALILLGNIYTTQERFDEAENVLNEALGIYKDLVDNGEKKFLKEFAGTLNNLGNLYTNQSEFQKAELKLNESLKIRRSLIIIDKETNELQSDIATTLNNLGVLYGKQRKFEKIESLLKESLEIYQSIAKGDPSFIQDVVMSLGNLASLYNNLGDFGKSEVKFNEAYDLLKVLSKGNPRVILQQKIDLFYNWSILLKKTNRFSESENKLDEALKINNALSYIDELAFRSKKGSLLTAFGDLYSLQNKTLEAEKSYNEAFEIVVNVKQKDSKAFLFDLLNVLINGSIFFEKQNKFEQAEKNYTEALILIEDLKDDSVLSLNYKAKIKYNLGRLQVSQGKFIEAKKNYSETIDIRRKLIVENRFSYLNDLGMSLEGMALLQIELGEKRFALKSYSETIDIYRELVAINFDVYSYGLSNVLTNFGVLHYKMGNYDASEQTYQEALEIRRMLAKENPEAYSQDVAVTLFNIANLLKDQGKIDEAEEKYLEAIKAFRQLAKHNPDQFNLFLAKNLVGLSLFYITSKRDKEKSISYCKEAVSTLNTIPPIPDVLTLRNYTDLIFKEWVK